MLLEPCIYTGETPDINSPRKRKYKKKKYEKERRKEKKKKARDVMPTSPVQRPADTQLPSTILRVHSIVQCRPEK
jgi:hypothetical protein